MGTSTSRGGARTQGSGSIRGTSSAGSAEPRRAWIAYVVRLLVATTGALACHTPSSGIAQSSVVRPYFLVIVDNSGSMADRDGRTGNNSCGQPVSRMSDAKCVLQDVFNGYGDVGFGLAQFRVTCSTRNPPGTNPCPTDCGCPCSAPVSCSGCNHDGSGCNASGGTAVMGQILVPIEEENQERLLSWVDYSALTCDPNGADPDLEAQTSTPLAGALRAARQYFEGGDPDYPTSPIATDPAAGCRPIYVVLLTDGSEQCTADSQTVQAATELRATVVDGVAYDIRTIVLGFGVGTGDSDLETIAAAGGTDAPGPFRAYYAAAGETQLALALSQIIGDSLLTETCNGADDDCDAAVDEGYRRYCNWDGAGSLPAPTLCVDPGEAVCDGLDNNCDGRVDEGLNNACGTCGAAPAELCDRVDNDCDGPIDEGVCGDCVPSSEICDGADNDCDTAVDEALTRPCGTDVGECTVGAQTCSAGSWGGCTGVAPEPETCNGLDDDCDGLSDGISRPCGDDRGECQAGTQLCLAGSWGSCTGAIGPASEVCNGADDDCDGVVDDGNPGGGGTCGSSLGACALGTRTCVGGALGCLGGVTPVVETCDGVDEDCDGAVDEEVSTMGACGDETGDCNHGVMTCVDGDFRCVGARGPSSELCDGRDNDCDGAVDDGNPGGGAPCGTDTGECRQGTSACMGGELRCVGEVAATAETCDGLDNDCDGLVDNGNPGGGAPCGASSEGECELGAVACASGELRCVGEATAVAEVCDDLDNDCDGSVDEGDPGGGAPCGHDVGECISGTRRCAYGELICDGERAPVDEVCNGLDDDCDGAVDDGLGVGVPCGSDTGECSPGLSICLDGELRCEGSTDAIPELCDLLDNDCDGTIDEGDPEGGAPCGTEDGACRPGVGRCSYGAIVCTEGVLPDAEACDCEDNDCDGAIDEEPEEGASCPGGSTCFQCQCALPCHEGEFGFTCPTGKAPVVEGGVCRCVAARCDAAECATQTLPSEGPTGCAPGAEELPLCVCRNNACSRPCEGVVCPEGQVCDPRSLDGRCVLDRCPTIACAPGELCDLGTGACAEDPCENAECSSSEACRAGACEPSCANVDCAAGERCHHGTCLADACAGAGCTAGEVCDPASGECVTDLCGGRTCPAGWICDPTRGDCAGDPCHGLRCPVGESCRAGECVDPGAEPPDAGMPDSGTTMDAGMPFDAGLDAGKNDRVLAGGGWLCATRAPAPAPSWGIGLGGLALLAVVVRRWRR